MNLFLCEPLGEKAGIRPVIILTRSAVIPHLNKVTVAEITTQGKGYPTEVDINHHANLAQHSFVQLDNIQTIPKHRLKRHIGTVNDTLMRAISQKAILALNLEAAFSEKS